MNPTDAHGSAGGRIHWLVGVLAVLLFGVLMALGTWQVQRLQWKEELIAMIGERTRSQPLPLPAVERLFADSGDVEYTPTTVKGEFNHSAERHFFATHDGQSGFFIYTPLRLEDRRLIFVNRGFVPFELKDPATRPDSEVAGLRMITGLARNPLPEKPSALVPDNDPDKNIFFWKDREAFAASAGLGSEKIVPFFIDADDTPNPGGWPVGGVTIISLPNSHLQYAVTWYGLAAVLAGVVGVVWWGRRKPR
ncbi:MAG: SURF1 family protein [Pseudaminobacter sp.]|nr:SURF1 family protein [Pseudaminobacter sp.]